MLLFGLFGRGGRDGLLFLDGAVFFVAAEIVADLPVFQLPDAGGEFVDEIPVVRDEDERALVVLQRILEPFARVDVQMVRRLVEDEQVDLLRSRLCSPPEREPTVLNTSSPSNRYAPSRSRAVCTVQFFS